MAIRTGLSLTSAVAKVIDHRWREDYDIKITTPPPLHPSTGRCYSDRDEKQVRSSLRKDRVMTVEPKTTQFDPTRGFAMNKHGWSGKKPSGHLIKILDGAFGCDAKKTFDAALDLASSLEEMGETGAATRIRTRLERVPASVLKAGQPGRTLNPISSNGGRHMLDERKPLHGQRDRLILAESVNRMIDDFLADIRAHDALAEAGVADPCRLLIEGPPGVGKTSIASVIACELDFPLLTLRCDGVIDSLMGSTGSNLRKVFDHAALTPCVLLLDEFDALARSRSGDGKDVGKMHRVVIGLASLKLQVQRPDPKVRACPRCISTSQPRSAV